MPSTDDLKARAAARELRKQKREAAVEQAATEAKQLSDKQQANEQNRDKEQEAKLARIESGKPEPKPAPKPKRADVTRQAKQRHEQQAAIDARRMPTPVDPQKEFAKWGGTGAPPLHVLNALASDIDTTLRDQGKDIAQAAGKAAYETFVGKLGGQRNRHARMRAQIAAGQAKLAESRTAE